MQNDVELVAGGELGGGCAVGGVDGMHGAGVIAALDTRAADGLAVILGEPQSMPIGWWLDQIVGAAGSDAGLVRVPDPRATGGPRDHRHGILFAGGARSPPTVDV